MLAARERDHLGLCRAVSGTADQRIPELAVMADVLNPEQVENKPLNTEMEIPTLEAVAEQSESSVETLHTPEATSATPAESAVEASSETAAPAENTERTEPTEITEDVDFGSMEDFAAALESFDREQAAEAAAQSFDDSTIVPGTVIKLTDKHVVVDVGMKSEGLIPLEQVLDHAGEPKLKAGDAVEVVIEREDPEGGYVLNYEKALRHRVWDDREGCQREDAGDGNGSEPGKGRPDGGHRHQGVPARFADRDSPGAEP